MIFLLPFRSNFLGFMSVTLALSITFGEFTYEEGEWETMLVDLISREVSSLPIQDFVDDPQLLQKVDRINKLSIYMKEDVKGQHLRIEEEEAAVVYRRKSVDSKIPVIVLRSREDHLKIFNRKRTFVVLRQNPLALNNYFVSYVYLRFWTDKQENCTETYLNEKICLEWDTWDNDRGEIKTKSKYFGWTDCASSFLFSCTQPNDPTNKNGTEQVTLVDRGIRNTTLNYDPSNSTKLTFTPAEGFLFDDTIDAFWDLETNAGEGYYIRETIRHSSVFNNPESFVLKQGGSIGTSGRSLGSEVQGELEEIKERAKVERVKFAKTQLFLRLNLESRSSWLKRKNFLSSKIRAYAKELGFMEVRIANLLKITAGKFMVNEGKPELADHET